MLPKLYACIGNPESLKYSTRQQITTRLVTSPTHLLFEYLKPNNQSFHHYHHNENPHNPPRPESLRPLLRSLYQAKPSRSPAPNLSLPARRPRRPLRLRTRLRRRLCRCLRGSGTVRRGLVEEGLKVPNPGMGTAEGGHNGQGDQGHFQVQREEGDLFRADYHCLGCGDWGRRQ